MRGTVPFDEQEIYMAEKFTLVPTSNFKWSFQDLEDRCQLVNVIIVLLHKNC